MYIDDMYVHNNTKSRMEKKGISSIPNIYSSVFEVEQVERLMEKVISLLLNLRMMHYYWGSGSGSGYGYGYGYGCTLEMDNVDIGLAISSVQAGKAPEQGWR